MLKVLLPALVLAAGTAYLTLAISLGYPPSSHEPFINGGCVIALLGCAGSLVLAAARRTRTAWLILVVPLAFCISLIVYDSAQVATGVPSADRAGTYQR